MNNNKFRIGLVLDYISSEYADEIVQGVSSYCNEMDMELLIFQIGELRSNYNNNQYQQAAITSQINKENLDGIIVSSGTQLHAMNKKEFSQYLRSYKPLKIVSIGAELPEIPSILGENEHAFEALIQNLITVQECKKFLFVGVDSNSYDGKVRTDIFKSVLKKNDIPSKNVVTLQSNFEYTYTYYLLDEYFKKKHNFDFDAIVALNDLMAIAAMDFCTQQLKLRVPREIVITGYDDISRASFSNPPLTTVNQQIVFQGYKAAETLRAMLNGENVPGKFFVSSKAILRQSTAKHHNEQERTKNSDYLCVEKNEKTLEESRISVSEWYNKRSQLFSAANFYSELRYNTPLEKISDLLTHLLQAYGFGVAAVVVYHKPIETDAPFEYFNTPSLARIVAGFDYYTGFQIFDWSETVEFNPKESLFPARLIHVPQEGLVAVSLFHESFQYGYILLSHGKYDSGVYDLIAKAISSQIASSVSYSNLLAEQSVIKDRFKSLDILVHTDELTGLVNRRGFMEMGTAVMNFSEAMAQSGMLIYCDMDGLKVINDTFGHDAGDIAISAQGAILKNCFRVNDTVARLSGDEFAVICAGLSVENFAEIKKKINAACKTWMETTGSKFTLSISLGYAEFPSKENGYNLVNLLSEADKSLYKEKKKKKWKTKKTTE